jgi:hypothetical protein
MRHNNPQAIKNAVELLYDENWYCGGSFGDLLFEIEQTYGIGTPELFIAKDHARHIRSEVNRYVSIYDQ